MDPVPAKLSYCCVIALLLLSFTAYSQIDISGREAAETDNTPLPDGRIK